VKRVQRMCSGVGVYVETTIRIQNVYVCRANLTETPCSIPQGVGCPPIRAAVDRQGDMNIVCQLRTVSRGYSECIYLNVVISVKASATALWH
jgi:hypothetical protein